MEISILTLGIDDNISSGGITVNKGRSAIIPDLTGQSVSSRSWDRKKSRVDAIFGGIVSKDSVVIQIHDVYCAIRFPDVGPSENYQGSLVLRKSLI